MALSSNTNSILYGGDISAFAGQTETLEITSPDTPNEFNNVYIDDIVFSTSSVPEPGTCALLVCGAVAFGFHHWRRKT